MSKASKRSKKVIARFYVTQVGKEPLREWLWTLSDEDRGVIGRDIAAVEFGWPVGMPTCRPLGNGLYEVRSSLSSKRIARVLFAFDGDEIVLLHGFIKKTRKTSPRDLKLAIARLGGLE